MIKVTFTNGTNTATLTHVRNISWSTKASISLFESTVNAQNRLVKAVTITGYINQGFWENDVQAQQQLETDLRAVSLGSIQYSGLTDIADARFTSLEFSEFRGNPLAEYKIQFETQADNISAHSPVQIGSQVLSLAEGFTDISIDDSLSTQGDDETISPLKSRSFNISGSVVGSTLSEVNGNSDKIQVALQNVLSVVLTLSDGSSGSVYTVRPRTIDISSPIVRDQSTSGTFRVQLRTYDDYTKGPYTLGEQQQTFGTILWDVVDDVSHDYNFDESTLAVARVLSESLTVSGKRYYGNWSDYNTARDSFDSEASVPAYISSPTQYQISSSTGATLTLRSVDYGSLKRDGNDPTTDAKRYSASVVAKWEFVESVSESSIDSGTGIGVNYLGISFDTVTSISPSVQLDPLGNVTSRSASVSGTVLTPSTSKLTTINQLVALRSTKQVLSQGLTQDIDYYISSVNISSVETEFIAGSSFTRISVSISGSQLNTASQAKYFISKTFGLGNFNTGNTPTSPTIDSVTSLSKSFAYTSYQGEDRIESISISCSGEVWQPDIGSGAPQNPNVNIELFNKLDSTLRAPFSTADSGSAGTAAADPGGNVLPTAQSGEAWTIGSINIGNWVSFVKPTAPNAGDRYWKQTLSMGVKVAYDVTGVSGGTSSSPPVLVTTQSSSITLPAPKFVQLQVAGFGTVFKRVGTTPGRAVMTAEAKYRDSKVFNPGGDLPTPEEPAQGGGVSNWEQVKTSQERRNLVLRQVKEYIQIE